MNHNLISEEKKWIREGQIDLATMAYMVRLGIHYDLNGKIPDKVKSIVNDYIDKWILDLQKSKL